LDKIKAYFDKEGPFSEALRHLRTLVHKTELEETYKWNFPVYTLNGKNVIGLCAFKKHFGIWFFNGVFLSDPHGVLENAQEGKTMAMRHWKFYKADEINDSKVGSYLQEAIANQKKGIQLSPAKPSKKGPVIVPALLQTAFASNKNLQLAFTNLSPSKQREYSEYIDTAKQEKTKHSRIAKITPMIIQGVGLNDKYR